MTANSTGSAGGVRTWLTRWWGGSPRTPAPSAAAEAAGGVKRGYLSETEIFRDLTAEDMDWVSQVTTMITAKKGRTIYSQEEPAEVLFVLKRGRVQIYRLSSDGRKLTLATLGPGTIFGEMSLVGQSMHSTYAEAMDQVTLCVMSRTDLERVLVSKPQVALRLLDLLARRMRELEGQLEGIAFKSVPARLAGVLVDLADRSGSTVTGFSHLELAEMVGASRETVTKILDEFREAGLVELGRRRIRVRDLAGLRALAES